MREEKLNVDKSVNFLNAHYSDLKYAWDMEQKPEVDVDPFSTWNKLNIKLKHQTQRHQRTDEQSSEKINGFATVRRRITATTNHHRYND